MTVAASIPAAPRTHSGWLRSLAAGVILLAAINGCLYFTAPALFLVDLAKGPYTAANNLELTRVYHRAIPLYEQIAVDFPNSEYAVLSRIGIANSNVGLNRPAEALEQYEILLEELSDNPGFEKYRYSILTRMAGIYRDLSDAEGHARIFAELDAAYPDSDATKQERTYLATLAAIAASSEVAALPDDFPFRIDFDAIVLPETVKVGETITLTVPIAPAGGLTGNFSLMTGLPIWQALRVERITPTPTSVAEFWGRRQWQFKGIDTPIEIVATLEAMTPGTYELDIDLESNYDIIELGIVRSITVE